MSRSGRIPISVPESTEVSMNSGIISAKGKLGELSYKFSNSAKVELDGKIISVSPIDSSIKSQQMWGTTRTRIFNIVQGVTEGFTKNLILNGVGYKAALKGKILELNLGFSHPVNFQIPEDVNVQVPKPNEIKITGVDKQKVGQIAADIRSYRKPEPYKGKGIKYHDEFVRRKEGKKK